MTMNYANGVQFWSVKDNTPANGDRLTDAAGNEISIGGGGGIPNAPLFKFNGVDQMSDDWIVYGTINTPQGKQASANTANNFTSSISLGAVGTSYNGEIMHEGQKLTGSGTVTENSFTHYRTLQVVLGNVGAITITDMGSSDGVAFMGEGAVDYLGSANASTVNEAVGALIANFTAAQLVITEA